MEEMQGGHLYDNECRYDLISFLVGLPFTELVIFLRNRMFRSPRKLISNLSPRHVRKMSLITELDQFQFFLFCPWSCFRLRPVAPVSIPLTLNFISHSFCSLRICCIQNIRNFLPICTAHFGIILSALFHYFLQCFHLVLCPSNSSSFTIRYSL